MIGDTYWTTGIIVTFARPQPPHNDPPRYGARLDFFDSGFAEDGSTEGELYVRYMQIDLGEVLDTLIADAARLGIEFRHTDDLPQLYVNGDGEDPDEYLPADWREQLQVQADRLGWTTYGMERDNNEND